MTEEQLRKRERLELQLDKASQIVWAMLFLIFPIIFTNLTTDFFVFPKQILLTIATFIALLLWAVKMILKKTVIVRRTPFDFPILLFMIALLISSIFSLNRIDALIAFVPIFFAALSYFAFVNTVDHKSSTFVLSSLTIGTCLLSIIHIFSYFKIYPLPFPMTYVQTFTPAGSLLEHALMLAFVLPIALAFALPILRRKPNERAISFAVASVIIGVGLLLTAFELFTTQKPLILPFETGFQTAFASISQDAGRIAQGFFFGSGFGTYATDFTRFKQQAFNANPTLWYITFCQSSSVLLELLATTGLFGIMSFLFLVYRILRNPSRKTSNAAFFSLVVLVISAFLLPFTFLPLSMLFMLLGLFMLGQIQKHSDSAYEIELRFVALKNGIITVTEPDEQMTREEKQYSKLMPGVSAAIVLVFILGFGWFTGAFIASDVVFQRSLVAAQANNGTATYQNEILAINLFPYRSPYYRIFAQTNLALANSLANVQQKNTTPSQEVQTTIYQLIQQSINSARTATTYAPLTVANWQNLGTIYRSLIGFGQNAESFATLASQQAISLDPTNPQEYITLGGIYYQLNQWDNAIAQFRTAVTLKPDFANAYYNLGHAYEQKGDLQDAITQFQTVKTLVGNNPTNAQKISDEISALQAKLGNNPQANTNEASTKTSNTIQQPLTTPAQQSLLPTPISPVQIAPPYATGSSR